MQERKKTKKTDSKSNGKLKTMQKQEWSVEQCQLYKDNKWFFCKKPGHKLQDCKKKQSGNPKCNPRECPHDHENRECLSSYMDG